jgi:hypothetical protein
MDDPAEPDTDRDADRGTAVADEPTAVADEPTAVADEPTATQSAPVVVPEADVFRFDRVDRAGGRIHSPAARRGLTLDFSARGLEVFGPKAGRRQSIPWSDVSWVSIGAPSVGSGGQTQVPIDLESTAGLVRFLVRSDATLAVPMAALEIQVAHWTSPGGAEPASEPAAEAPVDIASDVPEQAAAPERRPTAAAWYPPPTGSPGYAPPYAFDTRGPLAPPGPFGPYAPYGPPAPARTGRRTRRTVTLVVALVLLVSGVGLGVGLSVTRSTPTATKVATTPVLSPDQRLAQQLLLTKADLPAGWQVSTNPGTAANSPALQQGEARITGTLARCMGITDAEGAIVLGGEASDQTAQTSSPIFVAPATGTAQGSVELQTAATVVRSHQDEEQDFALFANPKYPQCAATASAQELQLGVDQTSGSSDQAGPATVAPIDLPGTSGVQQSGLLMAFTVMDGTATVPVRVESITLGAHRVEAGLEVFAIGGQIPSQSLSAALSTFERRVASGGASSVV